MLHSFDILLLNEMNAHIHNLILVFYFRVAWYDCCGQRFVLRYTSFTVSWFCIVLPYVMGSYVILQSLWTTCRFKTDTAPPVTESIPSDQFLLWPMHADIDNTIIFYSKHIVKHLTNKLLIYIIYEINYFICLICTGTKL